ncbi:MAG: T9SS type A sorting domain-containing protein [Flavobacteriales bacterium]|nr:MAG: T9SS type A sorting domain-containing protein [Flavobacteriales bacterium]
MNKRNSVVAFFFIAFTTVGQWVPAGLFSSTLHYQASAFHNLDSGLFVYGANNPGPFAPATEGGIVLTDDGAASGGYFIWYEPSTNLEDIDVKMTGGKPLYMAAGHELYNRSIVVRPYLFPAYPFGFDSVRTGTGRYYRAIRMRNDLVAFTGGADQAGNGIIDMSTDTGATWTNIAFLPGQPVSRLHFVNDTLAFAATGGYSRLTNNGIAIPDSGAIYRSTDGGLNWAQVLSDTATGFSDVEFVNDQIGAATRNDGAVLRTTDGGNTWLPASVNLPAPIVMTSLTFRSDGTGFATGYRTDGLSGYVFISTDDGATWSENYNTSGLNSARRLYDVRFFDDAHGYACGQIRPLRTTGIITDQVELSSLTGALYPVPASDFLNVNTGFDGLAEVTISDALGRQMAISMFTRKSQALDVGGLPAGSYVVRVRAGSKAWSRGFVKL